MAFGYRPSLRAQNTSTARRGGEGQRHATIENDDEEG